MTAALAVSLYFPRSHVESDSTGGPSIRSLSFLSPSGSLAAVNRAVAANAGLQSGTDFLYRSGHTRATGAIRMNMAAASLRSARRLRSPSSPRALPRGALSLTWLARRAIQIHESAILTYRP